MNLLQTRPSATFPSGMSDSSLTGRFRRFRSGVRHLVVTVVLIGCCPIVVAGETPFGTEALERANRQITLGMYDHWRLDYLSTDSLSGDSQSRGFGHRLVRDLGMASKYLVSDLYTVYTSPARLDCRSLYWTSGVLAVGAVIYVYDLEIHDAFNRSKGHGPIRWLSDVGESFYDLGHGGVTTKYYVAGLVLGYVTGYRPLAAISADMLESYIIAGSLKNVGNWLAGRSRPFSGEGPRMWRYNQGTSFPSGHSINVVQFARVVSHHIDFWPVTVSLYTLAGAVAVERVTSDSHWPSDVYAGLVLGYTVADFVVDRNDRRRLKLVPTGSLEDGSVGLAGVYRF